MLNRKTKINIVLLSFLVVVCMNILTGYCVINLGMSQLHAENNFLENIQVALLILTSLTFLTHLLHEGKYHHVFALYLALFCFSSILRELDMETFSIPEILIIAGSGVGKKIMLASLWLFLTGYSVINYQKIKPQSWQHLFLEKFTLVIFSGGCLLIFGGLFDRQIIDIQYHQLYEELLETNGYYLLLIGAIMSTPYFQIRS